ncbi:hypothetical protein EJ04DRAFT_101947 [Polyplosphaeria fusca]|uniref:Uncharacterized protein n=1 Tax=Polyplosphaeria fusca TaxID=682080 RepID=A0A9P4UTY4_9PLEO|nr:hypothetical protein EJ04DRAFT_101947 [Polyplosphaeria fusca]
MPHSACAAALMALQSRSPTIRTASQRMPSCGASRQPPEVFPTSPHHRSPLHCYSDLGNCPLKIKGLMPWPQSRRIPSAAVFRANTECEGIIGPLWTMMRGLTRGLGSISYITAL